MSFDASKPVHYLSPIHRSRRNLIRKYPPNWNYIIGLIGTFARRIQYSRHHISACSFMRISAGILSFNFNVYTLPCSFAVYRKIWTNTVTASVNSRKIFWFSQHLKISFRKVLGKCTPKRLFSFGSSYGGIRLPGITVFKVLSSHVLRAPKASNSWHALLGQTARSCSDLETLPRFVCVLRSAFPSALHASR